MTSFIDPLIAFVSAHAELAYLTLFLAALLEAVPVVGSVIPGSTIILALSALIPGGELKLEWVLAAAAAGALIGDGSAFWLGHKAQREILNSWPLDRYHHPAVGADACTARRAGGIRAAPLRRDSASYRDRQVLLDTVGDRRRVDCRAGGVDHPPPAWRGRDRAGNGAGSKGFSIRFWPATSAVLAFGF